MICTRRYDFISHSVYCELILLPKVGWFTADNAANNEVALCNATARRSSTTCTIAVRGGQEREFGLGTQLGDEKIDSVPHRST